MPVSLSNEFRAIGRPDLGWSTVKKKAQQHVSDLTLAKLLLPKDRTTAVSRSPENSLISTASCGHPKFSALSMLSSHRSDDERIYDQTWCRYSAAISTQKPAFSQITDLGFSINSYALCVGACPSFSDQSWKKDTPLDTLVIHTQARGNAAMRRSCDSHISHTGASVQ